MTTFYTLGARFSGMAAIVCAVLAALAYPGLAKADEYGDCYALCGAKYNPGDPKLMECMNACMGNLAGIRCQSSCTQDEGCKSSNPFYCLCATPGFSCKYKVGSSTECDCRL
ncbi:MAG: hypothetical protein U0804_20585 [Gemmataceae bacterium]